MFGRLLWKMLRSNRGRLAVALVAVASGATVVCALLNLQFDIERKLSAEFRALGPNIMISAQRASAGTPEGQAGATAPSLMDEQAVLPAIQKVSSPQIVAVAPYLYFVARINQTPVVTAGTLIGEAIRSEPAWKLTGTVPSADPRACGVGRNVARQFGLGVGSRFDLGYQNRSEPLAVAFVLDTGGAEDDQVFVDLQLAEGLVGMNGIELVQLRVDGASQQVSETMEKLRSALPGYDVQPIRAVTQAEGSLLDRTRLLIASMIVLILVLTALSVLATMMALAMERRKNVGLMKALGGSISRIMGLFFAEVGVLGAAGGVIGCVA
ncbi:MAG TPA: FtsX-like permease family protein, partial [Candidatus Bathyarchaeia archaeon]|nr:FtsX-like permease family protein [Candidatus Bathyarchaeia archaeon]